MIENDTVIVLTVGILLGSLISMASRSLCKSKKAKTTAPAKAGEGKEEGEGWTDEGSSEEESAEEDGYVRNVGPDDVDEKELFDKYPPSDIKMVLVVNNGLKMGKGKIGAQCGHATLSGYYRCKKLSASSKYWTKVLEKWHWEGVKKICVKVDDSEQLLQVQKDASKLGIPSYVVADAGHTQIAAGSLTVCCLGPVESKHVDSITGKMKLI
jgi:PTH2 family peptidyl-tRNA hydrolase